MKKSTDNPYEHNMLMEKIPIGEYYDNLLMLDWYYYLIEDTNTMYQKESELYCWYEFAMAQKNPKYIMLFNMVRKEMANKIIKL